MSCISWLAISCSQSISYKNSYQLQTKAPSSYISNTMKLLLCLHDIKLRSTFSANWFYNNCSISHLNVHCSFYSGHKEVNLFFQFIFQETTALKTVRCKQSFTIRNIICNLSTKFSITITYTEPFILRDKLYFWLIKTSCAMNIVF